MKARTAHRSERRLVFDPAAIEAESDFQCEWEERDPDAEELDARTALDAEFGHHRHDD